MLRHWHRARANVRTAVPATSIGRRIVTGLVLSVFALLSEKKIVPGYRFLPSSVFFLSFLSSLWLACDHALSYILHDMYIQGTSEFIVLFFAISYETTRSTTTNHQQQQQQLFNNNNNNNKQNTKTKGTYINTLQHETNSLRSLVGKFLQIRFPRFLLPCLGDDGLLLGLRQAFPGHTALRRTLSFVVSQQYRQHRQYHYVLQPHPCMQRGATLVPGSLLYITYRGRAQ